MRFAQFVLLLGALGLAACQTAPPQLPKNTPLTADGYKKAVEDILGPIWSKAVAPDPDVTVGVVNLTFEIPAAGGAVRNLQTVSNTAGVVDGRIARIAVRQLRVPPIPEAILASEKADRLKFEEFFTVFDDSSPTPAPAARKRDGWVPRRNADHGGG